MKNILKLLRVKHYIKNLLVFVPLFFSGEIFSEKKFFFASVAFVVFCFTSSSVYIINDYKDLDNDKKHFIKRDRPLASGVVKPATAILVIIVCLIIVVLLLLFAGNFPANICLIVYFLLNIAYSVGGLKNKPIVDVVILASGFVLRVFYGGFMTDIAISKWLYLVIVSGSLYMGLGKRRNELKMQKNTREVLKYYTVPFLDKNMYVCVALTNIFYALWTLDVNAARLVWTVPVFTILMMRYSYDTEGNSDGDPVEVILHDKVLMGTIAVYGVCIYIFIYIFKV